MLQYTTTFLLLILRCVSSDLPPNFPRCDLNDPEIDNCIFNAAEELRPEIRKGIEKVKIPPLGPLFAPAFGAVQESKLLNLTATFVNCTIRGLDNYNFLEIRYNPKTMTFNGSVEFDTIMFNCLYEMKANILWFPAEGKGNMQMDLEVSNANFEVKGEMKKHRSVDYYNPTTTEIRGSIEDAKFYLSNLFGGNEELGLVTNNMINLNSKTVIQAGTPVLEKLAERALMRMMKSFTGTVPYYELFSQSQTSK